MHCSTIYVLQITKFAVPDSGKDVTVKRALLIMTAEITRRSITAVIAVVALMFLPYGCGPAPPAPGVPETLPDRLTDTEFWNMIREFSEPAGYFPSDNFLSNESGYQKIIPTLLKTVTPGGVYIGVGPEQNFTYIAAVRPKLAFIVDIRRQNMLEHLFYKALMETSSDRAEFLSRLFARRRVELATNSTPEELFRAYSSERASPALFEATLTRVAKYLEDGKKFELSAEDQAGIRHVAQAFFSSGPDLSYAFFGGNGDGKRMPSYSDLMTENDGALQNWNFLASEDQFQALRRMHKDNLIVPIVGDFAGPKAIRSVAHYVREHQSTVHAFYTSNVEQYLFQNGNWKQFYDNALLLPTDSTSAFIRYVADEWRFYQRSSMASPINHTLASYRGGVMQGYYDLLNAAR